MFSFSHFLGMTNCITGMPLVDYERAVRTGSVMRPSLCCPQESYLHFMHAYLVEAHILVGHERAVSAGSMMYPSLC